MAHSFLHNLAFESLERGQLNELQRLKLGDMLGEIIGRNAFYTRKLSGVAFNSQVDSIESLPFTTRAELEQDQLENPPYGTNLTYPLERYCRLHQTSGSGGRPMRWLDTRESWEWFKGLWMGIYHAAGVKRGERLLFPFSFGPFVGFWAAFESSVMMGNLSLAAGGMTSVARLRMMMENDVNVVCCTPTYALHLAEVAAKESLDIAGAKVSRLIVAGEPGGSIPEVRGRIESLWNARVFDHTGMTEMGALSFECAEKPGGVHIIETEFIAEVVDPVSGKTVAEGESGELVLTNLGRWGSPLIRYRTNDLVRLTRGPCACGRTLARLEGGILGRIDDMITVRGNNVFPSGLEAIIRRFPEVVEFRVEVLGKGALAEVRIEIEPAAEVNGEDLAKRIGHAIQDVLSWRPSVTAVACGSLPRFEMKAKRVIRRG